MLKLIIYKPFALLVSLVSLLLVPTTSALAEYRPPTNPRPISGRTTNTGTRGGCTANSLPITAIAPKGYVGQTIATRPTFQWYIAEAESVQLKFVLDQMDAGGNPKQVWQSSLQSRSGFDSLTLPADVPALEANQSYRWRVVLLCNPNRPSSAIISDAFIEVVPVSPTVQAALATAETASQRSDIYASNGLWYDAFAEASLQEKRSLLANLIRLEAGMNPEYSDRLKQIEAELTANSPPR
jgi:hypothetical protein